MNTTKSPRRQFLTVLGGAPICAFAASAIAEAASPAARPNPQEAAAAPGAAKHKFQEKSEMNFEDVFRFGFHTFIPLLKALSEKPGNEKLIEQLKEVASQAAANGMRNRKTPDRSIASFISFIKKPNHFWKNVATIEIVEESDRVCEVKVTECLWAKTVREQNASEVGYACICHPDFASAPAFNPKMRMERTKTLMQGHDCCNHRWIMEA